jgi:hypothetical protein
MSRSTKSDIRDVMQDEVSRGRNPTKSEAKREHAKRLRQAGKLLSRATEAEVVEVIRAAGIRAGSPEEQKALQIWRENRS